MSFITPQLLWILLPFVALPVIIHFINRMRYTPMDWAAMEFLFRAKKSSTKFAKLREIIILVCRCLAIIALAIALSRPQSGGWLGWAMSGTTDTVFIVLDRSSSMNVLDESGQKNKLQKITEMVHQAAKTKGENCRFVLVDSATAKIGEIEKIETLLDSSLYGVTDTSVDMNVMMNEVLKYINLHNPGSSEIWLCGDLQKSNWQPENSEWSTLNADLKKLKSKISFRLLALSNNPEKNCSILVNEVRVFQKENKNFLEVFVRINRNYTNSETIPVNIKVNGIEVVRQVEVNQEMFEFVHSVELATADKGGVGMVSLPEDQNPGDNYYYFAYGQVTKLKTVIMGQGKEAQILQLSANPLPGQNRISEIIEEGKLAGKLAETSLLIIAKESLTPDSEKRVLDFVERGGQVLLFAPLVKGQKFLKYIEPADVEILKEEKLFKIASWDETQGVLAKSKQGESLPVNKLQISKRQVPLVAGQALATFEDGKSLLSRFGHGRGAIYYFSGGIEKTWSDFYKGGVLLPLLYRLTEEGGKVFSPVSQENCRFESNYDSYEVVLKRGDLPFKSLEAGILKKGESVVVLNRPVVEDMDSLVTEEQLEAIFDGLEFSMFNETEGSSETTKPSELFGLFILFMLVFFVVEGFLTLRKPEIEVGVGR